ncbi:hypothetical protein [Rhizorhapis sp.]|uniref:hypothetical protein n=1 Tax=Rhizorhapis sp. TaxID=1968842 RepID=UPI002B48C352|nr:hypothetical protein [Rhizorhapis sp.]HKR17996.1 hypothetical protein [Rhizorhapis sp.]
MSIIITETDLAAIARYPLSLQEAARALWSGREPLPSDYAGNAPQARKQTRRKPR